MGSRLASDAEVKIWQEDGWVLLEGLVDPAEIDEAAGDLRRIFPSAVEYHADPDGVTEHWKGHPAPAEEPYVWPDDGPGFRPDQQRWMASFPFPGRGALNRLSVHPSIVDFAERALGSADIRIYQVGATAKYSGLTEYEQPMHTDRNHSWLPAGSEAPWWNLETFLYLTDVTDDANPTRLVSVRHSAGFVSPWEVVLPGMEGDHLYELEERAPGVRGSLLAYRSAVYHRGAPFGGPGTARFTMALAFKRTQAEWIGYELPQSRSTGPDWTTFVEGSSPRELELFGFPPPGHPVWTPALLERTALRYPGLDLEPWNRALGEATTPGT
jgi:hypothetical protein